MAAANSQMNDKEWRQMRRAMEKLSFEPLPDLPPYVAEHVVIAEEIGSKEEVSSRSSVEAMASSVESSTKSANVDGAELCSDAKESASSINDFTSPTSLSSALATSTPMPTPTPTPPPSASTTGHKATSSSSIESLATTLHSPSFAIYDEEVVQLDKRILSSQEALRSDVMGSFVELKQRLLQERDLERKKLLAGHSNDVAVLQNKIEELKEHMALTDQRHQDSLALMERFSAFVADRTQFERLFWKNKQSVAACFHGWRRFLLRRRLKRQRLHLAKRFDQLHGALGRGFHLWRQEIQRLRLAKEQTDQESRRQQREKQLEDEFERRIQQFERQLHESNRQLEISQRKYHQLEDDLRQVFLRGVSAMNLEALNLFSSTSSGGNTSTSVNGCAGVLTTSADQDQGNHHQPVGPASKTTASTTQHTDRDPPQRVATQAVQDEEEDDEEREEEDEEMHGPEPGCTRHQEPPSDEDVYRLEMPRSPPKPSAPPRIALGLRSHSTLDAQLHEMLLRPRTTSATNSKSSGMNTTTDYTTHNRLRSADLIAQLTPVNSAVQSSTKTLSQSLVQSANDLVLHDATTNAKAPPKLRAASPLRSSFQRFRS